LIAVLSCLTLVAILPTSSVFDGQRSPTSSNPPASEFLVIDGSKSPELIPQWRIWEYAFGVLSEATAETLPTVLYGTTTKDERAFLLKEARDQADRARTVERRFLGGVTELLKQPAAVVNEKTRQINIEYRWTILAARDRVLAGLQPAGRIALRQWVEARKAAFRVRIPKKELAHYLQPE
jgi:hypothetical protein